MFHACLSTAYVELCVLTRFLLHTELIPTIVFLSVKSLLFSLVAQGFCKRMSYSGFKDVNQNKLYAWTVV
jgi:hypothetical protein